MDTTTDTELLTGAEAAREATQMRQTISGGTAKVSRSAICKWVKRGHLKPAGLDERGHPLYDIDHVVAAERATRDIALHPELATRSRAH